MHRGRPGRPILPRHAGAAATRTGRWLLPAVAAALLAAGCVSLSSAGRMTFYPLGGAASQPPFAAEIRRSCEIDDCRIQRVEMRWPTGEQLTGQLRLLAVGVAPAEPTVGPAPATGAVLDDVPRRRPGVLTLVGDRGTRLQCDLVFSAGTRHAVGTCKTAAGAAYTVDL
jgi:hypothetical protein